MLVAKKGLRAVVQRSPAGAPLMPKPKFPYAGDGTIRKLLERLRCPTPFHVVRTRFWREIVSPALQASPGKTIESFRPDRSPVLESANEASAFVQADLNAIAAAVTRRRTDRMRGLRKQPAKRDVLR